LNIFYDIDIFVIQKFGGISRYFIELANSINDSPSNNTKVKIFDGFHRNNYLSKVDNNLNKSCIYVPDFKGAGFVLPLLNKVFFPIRTFSEIDIYHATYYSFPENLPKNIPKFITVYDMIHELYPSNFLKRDKTAELKAKALKEADHILAISNNTKNDLIEIYDLDPNKITVTYLGADHFKKITNLKKDKGNFLLYVGPRNGYKNFCNLLKAFKVLRSDYLLDVEIIAFGGGPFSKEEKYLISSLGLENDCVKQVSGSDKMLKTLYSTASVFVYPSLYEGFGIPPLEAMANGCPVAASKTSSLGEILGDSAALFNPSEISDIAEKIKSILVSDDIGNEYVKKGFNLFNEYQWQKCANITTKAYKKFI
tara:strand:+ start:433 stop:1533 length:1101 start_codon:yes stop_codon:yes gene_type:complete